MSLSETQLQYANTLAKQLFLWECLAEEHSAFLRQNLNEYATAYLKIQNDQEHTPPSPFPQPDEWDGCIAHLTRSLEHKAVTPVELVMLKAGPDVGVAVVAIKTQFHRQNRVNEQVVEMVLPPAGERNHALLQLFSPLAGNATPSTTPNTVLNDAPSTRYPLGLPSNDFRSLSIPRAALESASKVTQEDLKRFRQEPRLLVGKGRPMFVAAGGEIFKVASYACVANADESVEYLFYVCFADDDPEAFAHAEEDFFDLLATSRMFRIAKVLSVGCGQLCYYFTVYRKDALKLKSFVLLTFLSDTAHTVALFTTNYGRFVQEFGVFRLERNSSDLILIFINASISFMTVPRSPAP
ncbi:hypothetical protein C8R46DRAFT_1026121 [Mycena filopes]|nr:hypothetical protein C8R46DRAFT_1026121 [Mycena filopes]